MLLELRIRDFGIIEDIHWNLSGGLNVVTGETGAGKSMVIDAVEILLSGKISEDNIRYGASETCIEGVFELPAKSESFAGFWTLLEDNGLAADDGTMVISCELKRQGHSVTRINRHAVPRSLLTRIGEHLIDIHGQSDHLSLLNTEYHIDFLDAYARSLDLRRKFASKFSELSQVVSEMESLTKYEKETNTQEEFLLFQANEINQAKLQAGEDTELEQELKIISSSEQLKASSYEVYSMLSGEDGGLSVSAVESLNRAVRVIHRLVDLDPALKPELAMLEGVVPDVEEAARNIRSYSESMDYDPDRLEEIETRMELIRNLKRKYGKTIPDILVFLQEIEKKLGNFSNSIEKIGELKKQSDLLRQEMGKLGFELSEVRNRAAKKLVTQVNKELQDLKMPQVKFDVSIIQKQTASNGIPSPSGGNYEFTKKGVDTIEFIASTNPGEPFKPLAKIASTGEISRFMLALKGSFSKTDNIPILVFDEIDIGVGGRCGEVIGEKLWSLAQNRQVICITHLPQIAVFADAHFNIHKSVHGDRTVTTLECIKGEALIQELAVMLVGARCTEASVKSVKELMHKAGEWKKGAYI